MPQDLRTHPGTFFTHKRLPLTAGESAFLPCTGNFVAVVASLAPFKIAMDEGELFPVQTGFAFECAGDDYFQRLTVQSDADNVIEVYVGRGRVSDARMNVVQNHFMATSPTVRDIQSLPVVSMDSPTQAITTGASTIAPGGVVTFLGLGNPANGMGRRKEIRIANLNTSGANTIFVSPNLDGANHWHRLIGPGQDLVIQTDADLKLTATGANSGSTSYVVSQLFYPYDLQNPFKVVVEPPSRLAWAEDFSAYADAANYPPAATPDYPKIQIAGNFGTTTKVKTGVGGASFKAVRFPTNPENTGFSNGSRQWNYAYMVAAFFDLVSPRPTRCRFRWKVYCPASGLMNNDIGGNNYLAAWCAAKLTLGGGAGTEISSVILSTGLTTLATGVWTPERSTWFDLEWDHTFGAAADSVFRVRKSSDQSLVLTVEAHGVNTGDNNGACPVDTLNGSGWLFSPAGLVSDATDATKYPHLGPITVELF